ncbi:hypothetical protein BJ912DRAFT_635393 [Pholiota molesta]|nr:hypothetical protein BJ912DRAFT_635393 [Pholiota molesta]
MDQIYGHIALRVETTAHSIIGLHPVKFLDEFLPGDTYTPEASQEKAPTKSHLTKLRLVPSKPGKFVSMMCAPFDLHQEVLSSRTAPEADIYQILEDAKVHVASMRLSPDIDSLETKTQTWFSELTHNSCHRTPARMLCHRIVLDTVARDLSTFSWCKVLVSCVADAVEGVQQAYAAAGVLHRDISASNITIVTDKKTKERRGVLIDWDMTLLSQNHEGEAHARRIGTWAFISAKISSTPHRVAHTLWDDMESAFWVLIYHALLYLKHDYNPGALHHIRQMLFVTKLCEVDGSVTGGDEKKTVMAFCFMGRGYSKLPRFKVDGLNDVLETLGGIFDFRYDSNRPKELDDPDQERFPNLLRHTAMTMKPLGITPTGLVSLSNDSEPPADPKEWQAAKVDTVKTDFYPMPWSSAPAFMS